MEISDREWRSQLPNYVDRAQFESLILFQRAIESSEGAKGMISNLTQSSDDKDRDRNRLMHSEKEIIAAMKVWRDRVPH